MDGLIYLASPYSHRDPMVRKKRFEDVVKAAGTLINQGYCILSPIAHSHPIATMCELKGDWDFWKRYCDIMLSRCDEMWVLPLPGWTTSVGINAEIAICGRTDKPVYTIASLTERYLSLEGLCLETTF